MAEVVGRPETAAEKKSREDHALNAILDNPAADYDADHALVLVQSHGFKQGQLYLYERLRMYHMVVQHYMDEATNAARAGRKADAARWGTLTAALLLLLLLC